MTSRAFPELRPPSVQLRPILFLEVAFSLTNWSRNPQQGAREGGRTPERCERRVSAFWVPSRKFLLGTLFSTLPPSKAQCKSSLQPPRSFHKNDGNHENDEDNLDSHKQGGLVLGNHGNHENHGNVSQILVALSK